MMPSPLADAAPPGLVYAYEPLRTSQAIRLLHLHPGIGDEPLIASLEAFTIDNAPPYEALSYLWGDPRLTSYIFLEKTVREPLDRFHLNISRNLHKGLLRVRNESRTRTVWADAICINQADNRERSQQVSLMGLIFSRSSRALVL